MRPALKVDAQHDPALDHSDVHHLGDVPSALAVASLDALALAPRRNFVAVGLGSLGRW